MAPAHMPRLLGACAAALLSVSQAQPNEVIVSGTCSHRPQDILEGMTFRMMGRTLTGAPWYQSLEAKYFIYYDPDCSGGGDGEGWIIDDKQPDVKIHHDLDKDGNCQYLARSRWGGTRGPPSRAMWFMKCVDGKNDVWRYQSLKLTENPEVHEDPPTPGPKGCCPPPKTTAAPGLDESGRSTPEPSASGPTRGGGKRPARDSRGRGSPSAQSDPSKSEAATAALAQSAGPGGPKKLKFSGACALKAHLNGATFELEGRNLDDSAPFYKARGSSSYIYHVTNCDDNDGGGSSSRWVLDDVPPQKHKKGKKQADTQCENNLARLEDAIDNGPPKVATWRMICGDQDKPVELTLTLFEVAEQPEGAHDAPIVVSGGRRAAATLPVLAPLLFALLALSGRR